MSDSYVDPYPDPDHGGAYVSSNVRWTSFVGTAVLPEFSTRYNVAWPVNASSTTNYSLPYPTGATGTSQIPAGGCVVAGESVDMIGGFFIGLYNNALLSGGSHVILEDRTCPAQSVQGPAVCVLHTLGQDTNLRIALPSIFARRTVEVWGITAEYSRIVRVNSTISSDQLWVDFFASSTVAGQTVTMFAVVTAS